MRTSDAAPPVALADGTRPRVTTDAREVHRHDVTARVLRGETRAVTRGPPSLLCAVDAPPEAHAAEAVGVKYPTYAGHENGSSGFRADKGSVYARRFKVRFEWLMRGVGPMVDKLTEHRELVEIYDSLPPELRATYVDVLRKLAAPYQQPEARTTSAPAVTKSKP